VKTWLPVPIPIANPPTGAVADVDLAGRFLQASRICASTVALVGVLVLIGWQFDIGLLKSIRPYMGAMAPNSALACVLLGATLWLMHPACAASGSRQLARALPTAAVLISGLSLAEYLLGRSLGIDELLFSDPLRAVQTAHPGRMAMVSAMEFLALGLALLLIGVDSKPAHRVARGLALTTAVMSLVGLLGFLYGKSSLYAMPLFTGVALHTVVALLILAAGILAVQPARGFTTILTSAGAGGQLSRRLLPVAALIPLALGWLRLEGERAGLFQAAMGVDLMVVLMVIVFTALVWWNARLLEKSGAESARAEAALRKYADEVRDLYERAPCGYHSLDGDGQFIRINDTELSWLGYSRDEIVGKLKFSDLLVPEDRKIFEDTFPQFKAQGSIKDLEFEMQRKDGSILPVLLNASAVRDAAGQYLSSRSTVVDITERRRAEQALRQSDQEVRLRLAEIEQIYRYAPVGLFIFDRDYRFLRINERMAEINGFSPEAHIGKSMWEIVPDLAGQLEETYRPVFERGVPVLDVEIHGRTPRDPETSHDWLASFFPLKSEGGAVVGLIGAVLDISERKRVEQALRASEAEVRRLALTDPLTGIANRRRLADALRVEIHRVERYGGRLSAVMTDLDHFKRVNDRHGHHVGDLVLQEFARIVQSQCRDTDLVARFGGEEFVILMPEVGAAEAEACAERMRATLAQAIIPPLAQPVTASFGVAELIPGENSDALLRRADEALYAGKTAGRNRVIVAENAGSVEG
jgi:diguanylate cyclase (GGDEF)-like protein/PAS domain S-box-containing protein